MIEIVFSGAAHTGSLLLERDGWTLFSASSDPDAYPAMQAVPLDPTPDQADALADAIRAWAALRRADQRRNPQLDMLVLL